MRAFIKRHGLFVPLMILIVIAVAGLTYLAGTLSILTNRPSSGTAPIAITAVPPLPGTPVARFSQLDPAIVGYLEKGQPSYGIVPLDVLGVDVKPVGAYLPRTGNMQFDLQEPTPQPTPLPYATSPPLPNPPVPEQILPTVPFLTENGVPRLLPYAGDSCAPSGVPADGVLTQRYHLYHPAIDLGVPLGTPVIATHSGQVTYAGWSDVGYGYLVILQNGPFITYYAHNTSFNVTVDQFVGKGSIIAWSGSTGNSTGPHIHYEIRINDVPVDPLTFESRGYKSC
jgi:murein DD-endopeptidase MepM/ murein hydrolase activator NlpD